MKFTEEKWQKNWQAYVWTWCCLSPWVFSDFNRINMTSPSSVFFFCAATQRGSWPPHSWGFLDHTQRHTTVGRIPLDEWSARHRDLYLTTHNTHNRQTSMPPVGFKPTISTGERPQTYALDRAATGTGMEVNYTDIQPKISIDEISLLWLFCGCWTRIWY